MLKENPITKILVDKAEYDWLKQRVVEQDIIINNLQSTLNDIVNKFELQIKTLQTEIYLLKNGRKSHTSSTPPSHDIGKSNSKSLREKSDKQSGGQLDHEGSTLKMVSDPDQIIDHRPAFCKGCGHHLNGITEILTGRKQEIVIPPIEVQYVEHRTYSNACCHCGIENTGEMPSNITAPIQYGNSVSAILAYLFAYQHLPYNRMKTLMYDLFKLSLSEGTIDNLLAKMTQWAMPTYKQIQKRIKQSLIVGGDETGTKINGKKGWFHVWQNSHLTFIVAAMNRGYKTTEEYFEKGFSKAVYVSDCWSAQLKTPAVKHQLCLAHLIRELTNFEEALSCKWSIELKALLKQAINLKREFKQMDYLHPPATVKEIELKLEQSLCIDSDHFHAKIKAFIKRLIKNKDSILTFLYYQEVPFDNNGSERAIRNIKVKNKVSGSFRSENGAKRFAVLRSVIDTTIKNAQDVFAALNLLAKLRPAE